MKIQLMSLAAVAFVAAGSAPVLAGSHNPVVKDHTPRTTELAAKGRNSFTESQAQSRITKAGYSDVTALAKNKNGVWQGKAMKDGQTVNVALDYKGNVTVH